MDYEKEYNYYYDSYYKKIENRVKQYFVEQNEDDIGYGSAKSELMYKHIPSFKKLKCDKIKELENFQILFNNRFRFTRNYYRKVFEKDIIPKFEEIEKDLLPKNYNIKQLLIDIAFLDALKEIERLLGNNSDLFSLMYEYNELEQFEIVYYDIPLRETEIYKSLRIRKDPDYYRKKSLIEYTDNEIESMSSIELKTDEKYSLPLTIALLNEIGFFELEKIKKLSDAQKAELILILKEKDPKDKNLLRGVLGNLRVMLNPQSEENYLKYTSCTPENIQKAKILLKTLSRGIS
uniref:hypothetical protein n=1 Tax=Flavobacterium sp. TaxID=239 RepID=UPI00404A0AB6